MSLDVVTARGVWRIPMGDAEKDALAGAAVLQGIRAEQPVAYTVLNARRLHVSWPIANVEMESGIE